MTRNKSFCQGKPRNLFAAATDVTELGSGVVVSVVGVVVVVAVDVRGNPHSNSNSARVINIIRQKRGKQAFL